VKDFLSALPRHLQHDFVFTYDGHPIAQNFRKSLRTACKGAGITFGRDKSGGFVFHDMRSTVKTNMLRAGLDKAMRDVILRPQLEGYGCLLPEAHGSGFDRSNGPIHGVAG